MRAVDIIAKKREGQALNQDEIGWFIRQYTAGEVPDYQAAALLMAIAIRGMTREETIALTLAMAHSGRMLDLSDISAYVVDKHSSGGVGDKTTLIVLPLVASCGVPVAKMSGRGLGFTGGTLDKLESIRGIQVDLSEEQFRQFARANGFVLAGQSVDLAPADGKLYALRDVTATVRSLPLIAASIMSKKLAAGANGIVLDVKTGTGAFMKDVDEARQLARIMVDIGADAGRDMVALISDMNQPLGVAVGHALEVEEAILTLRGEGPSDLREHCLIVAAWMLKLAGRGEKWSDLNETLPFLEKRLSSGVALDTFRRLVERQGGDVSMVDEPSRLPKAAIIETLTAAQEGYLTHVDALLIAQATLILGAGREKKGDPIDYAVGAEVHVKVGDKVEPGAPLVTIYANDPEKAENSKSLIYDAFAYSETPSDALPLFYDIIEP